MSYLAKEPSPRVSGGSHEGEPNTHPTAFAQRKSCLQTCGIYNGLSRAHSEPATWVLKCQVEEARPKETFSFLIQLFQKTHNFPKAANKDISVKNGLKEDRS